MFDDRFARQNRCEPPPEFPLASPYAGIVHHLSGPNSRAHTQIRPRTSGSVDGAPEGSHQRSLSLRVQGFAPEHSRGCSTPWSVFQDGPLAAITPASSPVGRVPRSRGGHWARDYNTPRRELRFPRFYPPRRNRCWPAAGRSAPPQSDG